MVFHVKITMIIPCQCAFHVNVHSMSICIPCQMSINFYSSFRLQCNHNTMSFMQSLDGQSNYQINKTANCLITFFAVFFKKQKVHTGEKLFSFDYCLKRFQQVEAWRCIKESILVVQTCFHVISTQIYFHRMVISRNI